MPRRRPFGHVFRRRRSFKDADGTVRSEFRHGYYVRFRVAGREVTRFAGADWDTAIEYAHRLTREGDRQDLLGEQPRSDIRFEDFAGKYLAFAKQSMTEASFDSRRRLVNGVVVPFFRDRLLDEIAAPDVQRFLASQSDVAGATRNRALTAVPAIFRRAIDLGIVAKNPAKDVRRSKESRLALSHSLPRARAASTNPPHRRFPRKS